jgi:uncharacterized membrane protein
VIGRRPWSTTDRLVLLTVAAGGALVARSLLIGYVGYRFLAWNLFLAWIPYALGLGIHRLASRTEHGTGILVLPTALWLLFLPNAPYIVTDFVHLRGSAPELLVVDALVIAAFAALGVALGLLSLHRVHAVVARRLGERLGWAFVGGTLLLTGAGVWMGRVLRWNSWDVFTDPKPLLARTLDALSAPWDHPHAVGFTALFALGLLVVYRYVLQGTRARVPVRVDRDPGLL